MVVERGTKIHRRRGTMQRNSRRMATGRELAAMRKLSVAQQEIANFLISIGEVGVRFDANKAAKCATGAIVERVFVKEVAGGVRRDVILQGAGVEFLLVRGNRDREQIAPRAFANQSAETFEPRISGAEI